MSAAHVFVASPLASARSARDALADIPDFSVSGPSGLIRATQDSRPSGPGGQSLPPARTFSLASLPPPPPVAPAPAWAPLREEQQFDRLEKRTFHGQGGYPSDALQGDDSVRSSLLLLPIPEQQQGRRAVQNPPASSSFSAAIPLGALPPPPPPPPMSPPLSADPVNPVQSSSPADNEGADPAGVRAPPPPFAAAALSRLAALCRDGAVANAWEGILTFAVISLGAFLGCFIRVGFQYYKGSTSQFAFTVMYAQLLGCFIMGLVSEFQKPLLAGCRLERLFYVFVATGLCGSITTFSSWQYETNRLFLLQVDRSWGNIGLSYNGGRFLDYLVQLWIGFALPLAALNGGQHAVAAVQWLRQQQAQAAQGPAAPGGGAKGTGGDGAPPKSALAPMLPLSAGSGDRSPGGVARMLPQGLFSRSAALTASNGPPLLGAAESSGGSAGATAALGQPLKVVSNPITAALQQQQPGGAPPVPAAAPRRPMLCCGRCAATPTNEFLCEVGVLAACSAALVLVVAVPVTTGWTFLTITALMGSAGAYARFLLAPWNKALPKHVPGHALLSRWGLADGAFPWGTFLVNTLGSWVLAVTMLLAKFFVSYHDTATMGVLYGIGVGFCGCLTTMSTFVLELHRLPRRTGYAYCFVSFLAAQVGWGIIFDAYASYVGLAAVNTPRDALNINMCTNYVNLCARLMGHLSCPAGAPVVALGCLDGRSMATWSGTCTCGSGASGLDGSVRVQELLIDSQAKANVSQSLVAVWPTATDGGGDGEPTTAIDLCLSFENLCDHTLNRLGCPGALRVNRACGGAGITAWVGVCECGLMTQGTTRVAELIIDTLAFRRYDLTAYGGYLSAPLPLNFCVMFEDACRAHLAHVQCPAAWRQVVSCGTRGAAETFNGVCACTAAYSDIPSGRIPEDVMDAIMKPNWWPRMNITRLAVATPLPGPAAPPSATSSPQAVPPLPATFDACSSFESLCNYFMFLIGCPDAQQTVTGCAIADPAAPARPYDISQDWVGQCTCGTLDASGRMTEYIIDAVLAYDVSSINFIPPPVAPFNLMVASNPFRPLLSKGLVPVPGLNIAR